MLVKNVGIRDIAEIERVSLVKVLHVLLRSERKIEPKKQHYKRLEVDEFWTFVGSKSNKIWLFYAYDRETAEIVAWTWGKRDFLTAQKLRKEIERRVTFDEIATDNWKPFKKAFKGI